MMTSPKNTYEQPERLAWTYGETAHAAGISRAMVRKLVKNGQLEAIFIGRARRIPRDAVLRLCGVKGETNAE